MSEMEKQEGQLSCAGALGGVMYQGRSPPLGRIAD